MRYLPDPKETAKAVITCAGCAYTAKCSSAKDNNGCSAYRAMASKVAELPAVLFDLLVSTSGAIENRMTLEGMNAIAKMFANFSQTQRRLHEADYPLSIFSAYYVRTAGRGSYIHNYARAVLVDVIKEQSENLLVFVVPGKFAVTIPAPRKHKLKRVVSESAGQTIYTEAEWVEAKQEMLDRGLLIDPAVVEVLKRADDKRLASLLKTTKQQDKRTEAELLGNLDESLLDTLLNERSSNDDYEGSEEAKAAKAKRGSKHAATDEDSMVHDAAEEFLRKNDPDYDPDAEHDPDEEEDAPENHGLTGHIETFGPEPDAAMANELTALGLDDSLALDLYLTK